MIKGFATPQSTKAFSERFPIQLKAGHFYTASDLALSSIGLGTYLGEMNEVTDLASYQALQLCVDAGINVIDSAVNYRAQRSERVIGKALLDLIQKNKIMREAVFISTKGGFVAFDGYYPEDVNAYFDAQYFKTGVLKPEEMVQGCHAMTPRYLEYSLEQSLKNLDLETIDLFYIHNPETQLEEILEKEFYERLKKAFELLEKKAADGKIRMYGLATWNGFRAGREEKGYLSLEKVLAAAEEVGGKNNHFKAVQLPYNLAMPEAYILENQQLDGKAVSTIEMARAKKLLVFTSASLLQGRLTAPMPERIRGFFKGCETSAACALQFIRSTPGVTSALIGMKSEAHISENLSIASVPPLSEEAFSGLFTPQN